MGYLTVRDLKNGTKQTARSPFFSSMCDVNYIFKNIGNLWDRIAYILQLIGIRSFDRSSDRFLAPLHLPRSLLHATSTVLVRTFAGAESCSMLSKATIPQTALSSS